MRDAHLNTYFVTLPDALPMPLGLTWLYQYDDRRQPYLRDVARSPVSSVALLRLSGATDDVAIRVWHVRVHESPMMTATAAAVEVAEVVTGVKEEVGTVDLSALGQGRDDAGATNFARVKSVAEISVVDVEQSTPDQGEVDVDDLTDPLLRGLHCLTALVRSYRIACHRPGRIPTYQNILPWVLVAQSTVSGSDEPVIHSQQKLSHDNVEERPPGLVSANELAIWQRTTLLLSAADPLTLYRERMLEAEKALSLEGDFGAAVIAGALGGEVLLDAVIGLLLWEKYSAPTADGSVEEAVAVYKKPLRPRLRSSYHPLIGGSWTPGSGGPADSWDSIARLRGRILHRGYRPKAAECAEALTSVNNLYEQIAHLISTKAKVYPRTAMMMVGKASLEARGTWVQIRKFASERATTEPPWRDSYASWRDKVDTAIDEQ